MRTSTETSLPGHAGHPPVLSPVAVRPLPAPQSGTLRIIPDSIEDLGIRSGKWAMLVPGANEDNAFAVRVVGRGGSMSLLVTEPAWAGQQAINPGETCRVRVFHGRRAVTFMTTVLGMEDYPAPCLALALPDEITICEVRIEGRFAANILAEADHEGGVKCQPCHLRDMSMNGLRLNAASRIAPIGSRIVARFTVDVAGNSHALALAGEIRNLASRGEGGWDQGIELDPVELEEKRQLAAYLRAHAYAAC